MLASRGSKRFGPGMCLLEHDKLPPTGAWSGSREPFLPPWHHASAGISMCLCVCVCVSVCHKRSFLLRKMLYSKSIVDVRLCPCAAFWRVTWNMRLILCENMMSSTKPEVQNIITLLPEQTRATEPIGNMYRKFGEVWACGFWDIRADRHAHTLIAIARTLPGAK